MKRLHLSAYLFRYISLMAREKTMRVISTECTEEEQKKDMPELKKLHAQALKTEMMWEFFGGTITLQNGNQYQVTN